jgi:maleamate amidohydrolase
MALKFLERDERVSYIADTYEMYQKAGIGGNPDTYKKGKRPAILVVDLQETFTSMDSPMGGKEISEEGRQLLTNAVENTRMLLDRARMKGMPVIYLKIVFRDDGSDCGRWGERSPAMVEACKQTSRWATIDSRVAPDPKDYVIEKKVMSGFIGTPLLQTLTSLDIDTCVVTGISLSGCVRQTAMDAIAYGFYTVVPEECVGDRSPAAYKASLFDIMTKAADVASLSEVLRWMDGR